MSDIDDEMQGLPWPTQAEPRETPEHWRISGKTPAEDHEDALALNNASDEPRAVPKRSLDWLEGAALAWQSVTFPHRTQHSIATHLRKEARELVGTDDEPATEFPPDEMADVFLLLVALAKECGVDLAHAVAAKLEENYARTWGKPDADGVVEHVRGAGE
jgi:hypothetical protein